MGNLNHLNTFSSGGCSLYQGLRSPQTEDWTDLLLNLDPSICILLLVHLSQRLRMNYCNHSVICLSIRLCTHTYHISHCLCTHTYHISHCETKSHRILALLDPVSHKIFKSHRIFMPFNKLFFEELEINPTIAWLSQA